MTSLKEFAGKLVRPFVDSDSLQKGDDFVFLPQEEKQINEWAEGYIRTLEEFFDRYRPVRPREGDAFRQGYIAAEREVLRFLRGET